MRRNVIILLIVLGALFCFSGCSFNINKSKAELVNTKEFDSKALNDIEISYIADRVILLKSTTDKVILKEYLNDNKESYYATALQSNGELLIKGGKPSTMVGDNGYIEVYIPDNFKGNLKINTESGGIDATGIDFELNKLKAKSQSGGIKFSKILCNDISVESESGSITIEDLCGKSNIKTESGSIRAKCKEKTGDITAKSQSGSIRIELPEKIGFNFSASSSSGSISTFFDDKLNKSHNKSVGTVGENINGLIDLSTESGSIRVIQGNN